MKTSTLSNFIFAAGVVLGAVTAIAGSVDPVNKSGKIAIKGYDPVAYFQDAKPVKGSAQFVYQWMGATWQFASAAHRDQFASTPEKYAPQYGGYCSYAVSQGQTAPIDPEAWRIVDGKLYLNYSKGVQQTWEKDIPGYVDKADKYWPGLHR